LSSTAKRHAELFNNLPSRFTPRCQGLHHEGAGKRPARAWH
jgi:hypothetical protein